MYSLVGSDDKAAEDFLKQTVAKHLFVVLVFYRGDWCPYCERYSAMWQELLPEIRDARGEVYMATSQVPAIVERTASAWKSQHRFVCDEAAALAKKFGVVVDYKIKDYPHGTTQPAVVVLSSPSDDEGTKELYKWVLVPNKENLGGVTDRVLPKDVWPIVQKRLGGDGQEPTDEELKSIGTTTSSDLTLSAMLTRRFWNHVVRGKHS